MVNLPLHYLPAEGKVSVVPLCRKENRTSFRFERSTDLLKKILYKDPLNWRLFLIIIITASFAPGWSQSVNYKDLFGTDWEKAAAYEKENRNWMEPILTKNNISYPLAIAIVFPELVRYSALRDKMEITLLKALYINLGDDYADFSIGQFQMKPSFAEIIRKESSRLLGRRSLIRFKPITEYEKPSDFRKSIVTDLENPETEFMYFVAFLKICEKKYNTNSMHEDARIGFLATAYNYGPDKSAGQIEMMTGKKFFNIKLFKTTNTPSVISDFNYIWGNLSI